MARVNTFTVQIDGRTYTRRSIRTFTHAIVGREAGSDRVIVMGWAAGLAQAYRMAAYRIDHGAEGVRVVPVNSAVDEREI